MLFSIYSFRLTDSCEAQRLVLTHWTRFCSQVSRPFGSVASSTVHLPFCADGAFGWRLLPLSWCRDLKNWIHSTKFSFLLRVRAFLSQGIWGTLGQHICGHPGRSPRGAQVCARGTYAIRGQSTLLPVASRIICFSAMFNRLCLVQGKPH